MYENFKVIAHMKAPIAGIDFIILDSIISAAKAKEILGEDFYSGKNIAGSREMIENMLNPILDRKHGVYCTSIGIGENRESTSSWSKRWDGKNDDIVSFRSKGKERVDIGAGYYKNYHMPIVTKSYKTITFYVRGDLEEVKRLLEKYIFYLGKKGNQGYGQILRWEFEKTEEDLSVWDNGKANRPIPTINAGKEYIEQCIENGEELNVRMHPIIPPYWRRDNLELCIMPSCI